MLSEEQIYEQEKLNWIKDQIKQFDSDVMTGKMSEAEYSKEMYYFMQYVNHLEDKYDIEGIILNELRKDPLKNMGKIWMIVGKNYE